MSKDESKGIESFDDVDEFDLESLIVEGKEDIFEDLIEVYNPSTKQTRKMRIYIKPISHYEWSKAAKATGKKSDKDLEELVCAKCLVKKEGMPVELSKIKGMQKGVITQIYEKIKIISGQITDPFEEKYLDKITDF